MTVPDDPDAGVTAEQIRVGWMGDLTGPTAAAQTPNNQGTEAYFAKVNADGGVLGRELVLVSKDDQYSQETILQNFRSWSTTSGCSPSSRWGSPSSSNRRWSRRRSP